MSQIKFTSKFYQLPLDKLKIIEYDISKEKEDVLTLTIKRRTKYCKCPHCKKNTKKRYDQSEYIQKGVKHFITFKYELQLSLIKRRFYCKKCKKDFHEQYEFVPYNIGENRKIRSKYHTKLFEEYVLFEWVENSVAEIARRAKVSEYRLWSIIGELDMEKLKKRGIKYMEDYGGNLVLGIDEHSFKGHDYVVVIVEHNIKKVVGILKSPKKKDLKEWLESLPEGVRDRIAAVTTDMTNKFSFIIKELLGDLVVEVIDKFHVIQNANKTLDEVRNFNNWMIHTGYYGKDNYVDITAKKGLKKKKGEVFKYRTDEEITALQKNGKRLYLPSDPNYKSITIEHYLFQKYKTLFLLGEEKLSYKQSHRLNQILVEFDPKGYLYEMYNAKEKIRYALKYKDKNEFEEALNDLKDSTHYKIQEFYNMMVNHKQGILNYFNYEFTNARVEGKNNKAKVMKRIAYGYNNKENYMKKLLFAL